MTTESNHIEDLDPIHQDNEWFKKDSFVAGRKKMAEVWKYELNFDHALQLPKGAKVLSAGEQLGDIMLWVLVNPDPTVEHEVRQFEVHGTGHQIVYPDELTFIDTVHLNDGKFIFHVFERVESSD